MNIGIAFCEKLDKDSLWRHYVPAQIEDDSVYVIWDVVSLSKEENIKKEVGAIIEVDSFDNFNNPTTLWKRGE